MNLGPISTALEAELRQQVQRHGIVIWLDRDGSLWQGEQAVQRGAYPDPRWHSGSGCMNPKPLNSRLRGLLRRFSAQSGLGLADCPHWRVE